MDGMGISKFKQGTWYPPLQLLFFPTFALFCKVLHENLFRSVALAAQKTGMSSFSSQDLQVACGCRWKLNEEPSYSKTFTPLQNMEFINTLHHNLREYRNMFGTFFPNHQTSKSKFRICSGFLCDSRHLKFCWSSFSRVSNNVTQPKKNVPNQSGSTAFEPRKKGPWLVG